MVPSHGPPTLEGVTGTASNADPLVLVANRLPVSRTIGDDGTAQWERSPGGLVSALEAGVPGRRVMWVGWTGDTGCDMPPAGTVDIDLAPVAVADDEIEAYYGGFSNSTIWPLYHDAIRVPDFRADWWSAYRLVNERFADRTASIAPTGATVWVHDYHLQLVPRLLRERRPDLRIGFYLHIPFPAQELYLRLPWRTEIADGLLGADAVSFQTVVGAENFRRIVRRILPADVAGSTIEHRGRRTLVSTHPVGIDAARIRRIATDPTTVARAVAIREGLGDPRVVLLGVDRLDYTKGIEVRLLALRDLLERGEIDPDDVVFVQIAQPSRDDVPGYAETRARVEQLAGGINGDFGRLGGPVVQYLRQGQSLDELVALYRAADVMLVTPFRDGMNLVAKEYVAARVDGGGTLVLSEFAGAAHQLRGAVLVNPFDVDSVAAAIRVAVNAAFDHPGSAERRAMRRRMTSLQTRVHREDASAWVQACLAELEKR